MVIPVVGSLFFVIKVSSTDYHMVSTLVDTWQWFGLVWFGLVWFNGISTIVGYLMPNPLYTYILDI